jgi:hypothetical protein
LVITIIYLHMHVYIHITCYCIHQWKRLYQGRSKAMSTFFPSIDSTDILTHTYGDRLINFINLCKHA